MLHVFLDGWIIELIKLLQKIETIKWAVGNPDSVRSTFVLFWWCLKLWLLPRSQFWKALWILFTKQIFVAFGVERCKICHKYNLYDQAVLKVKMFFPNGIYQCWASGWLISPLEVYSPRHCVLYQLIKKWFLLAVRAKTILVG